jgi:release factor glutamine methyltransferase
MTVGEWITAARQALSSGHITSASMEAQILAAHTLGVDRPWLLAHGDQEFPDLAGANVLSRRLAGEPLAYILGYREFYGRVFAVNPDVLIPRQDTEILVEVALTQTAQTILDIGTGSGCIAVTLQLECPHWAVTATDISLRALNVAERNAESLGATIDFVTGDLLTPLVGRCFDLIVSNPPYIDPGDPDVADEVRRFEPASALFAEEDGLAIYRRLAETAQSYLTSNGIVLLEVGHRQSESVRDLFQSNGWRHLDTWLDFAGIPRVVGFQRPTS